MKTSGGAVFELKRAEKVRNQETNLPAMSNINRTAYCLLLTLMAFPSLTFSVEVEKIKMYHFFSAKNDENRLIIQ